jgi:hypothetical protein
LRAELLHLEPYNGARYRLSIGKAEEWIAEGRPMQTPPPAPRSTLESDRSDKFHYAEFGLETALLLVAVGMPFEIMVAGGSITTDSTRARREL